jgi:ADP-heptose:LPS heptosyltransferase
VLATGAIRLLAREFGEENLTLCVKTILVPLARDQFPRAEVLELPTAAERKVVNLFVRNFVACLPLWARLRARRFDAAVCFRSMRNYLETFLFYSAAARRFVACENILLRSGRKVRTAVEGAVRRLIRPDLVPYPGSAELPLEIEANRVVVERLLGRPVAPSEVLPSLRHDGPPPPGLPSGPYWLCAPITNLQSKVYPFAGWREILASLRQEAAGKKILLVGVASDRPKLEELLAGLRQDGAVDADIHLPADLAAFVRLIAGAEAVISVDTAAAHFATALDRPTVVLFSGLHLGMFGPWKRSDRQVWLLPEAAPEGQKKRKWHTRLSPTRAAEAVRSVLAAHESCFR